MAEPFEYAIKKDVRNNPIVREVDEERQRELWKSVGVAACLVAVLLFSVWQRVELLQNGYEVDQLQKDLAVEQERQRHLHLEVESLRSPERIEQMGIDQLRLVKPGPDDAMVIQRVVPAEPPASSVVARW